MEKTKERLAELKEKGYQKLEGKEREEYKVLKAHFEGKEKVDHVLTEQDFIDNPGLADQGVKVGDTIKVAAKEDALEMAAPVAAAAPVKSVKGTGQYAMNRNVRWNDTDFKKDSDIDAKHPALKLFLEQGYAREKTIS